MPRRTDMPSGLIHTAAVVAGALAASANGTAADLADAGGRAAAAYFESMRAYAKVYQRDVLGQPNSTSDFSLVIARGATVPIGTVYNEAGMADFDSRCVIAKDKLPSPLNVRDVPVTTVSLDVKGGFGLPDWLLAFARIEVNVKRTLTFGMLGATQVKVNMSDLRSMLMDPGCAEATAGLDKVVIVRGVISASEKFIERREVGGELKAGDVASATVRPLSAFELEDRVPTAKFYVISTMPVTRGSTIRDAFRPPDDELSLRFEQALDRRP